MTKNEATSGRIELTVAGQRHVATWVAQHEMITITSALGDRSAVIPADANASTIAKSMLADLIRLGAGRLNT